MWPGRALEQGAECEWRGAQGSTVFLYGVSDPSVSTPAGARERRVCAGTWHSEAQRATRVSEILHNCGCEYCLGCVCVCVCVCVRACVCPAPGV